MKTFKLSVIGLVLLGAISCKKTDNSASVTITSDQAADMAASSLSENSYGLTSMTDDVAANAQAVTSTGNGSQTINSVGVNSVHQECGTTLTDSASNSGSSSSVTFDYFVKYTHTLNCNTNNEPDNIMNTLNYHGDFDGPRITTTVTGSANAKIAGLTAQATNFVINGEYTRAGSYVSKVGNKASGNSNVDITVTNLLLSKPGRKILSGTGTFTITGTSPKGSFSFAGNIVFNGDGTATLTVTGGSSYVINLANGIYDKH